MNLTEIMKALKEQKETGNVKTMHNQTAILSGSVGTLKKHEMLAFKASCAVFPKELQLPFNPIDPLDDAFNSRNKFIVKDIPSEFIKAMKEKMQEDESLHTYYAGLIQKTVEEYDVSDNTVVTDDDFKIFNKYTVPAHYSEDTQKITTPEAGKFGMERLSPLILDEDNNITNADEYLFGRLYLLERAIRNERIADFQLENGRDTKALSSDKKERFDAIRKSSKISYPKKSGVVIFLEFPGKEDKDGILNLSPIETKNGLDSMLRYYNCNTDELKKINKKIGKSKIDKNIDYLILKIAYGDGNDPNSGSAELALYNSREYEGIDLDTTEDPHKLFSNNEEFETAVKTLFSNSLKGDFEKMARKSIWKFKPISDNDLRGLYTSRLVEIKPYITRPILLEFGDVIESISMSFKAELDKLDAEGKLKIAAKENAGTEADILNVQEDIAKLDKLDAKEAESDVIDEVIDGAEDLSSIV